MLDDKIRKFAEDNDNVRAVFRSKEDRGIYYFITKFDGFDKFYKDKIFSFWHTLLNGEVGVGNVFLTILPIENPERYKFLGECIYARG